MERLSSTHLPDAINLALGPNVVVRFDDIVKRVGDVEIEVIVAFAGIDPVPSNQRTAIPTTNPVVLLQNIVLVEDAPLQSVNNIGSATDSRVNVSFADASILAPPLSLTASLFWTVVLAVPVKITVSR